MAVSARDVLIKYQASGSSETQEMTIKYIAPTATDEQLSQAIESLFGFSQDTLVDILKVDTVSIKNI